MIRVQLNYGNRDENAFNSWVVGTLKGTEGWNAFKVHGSVFQSDKPDIFFAGDGVIGMMENKFVDALKLKTRDSTIMVGEGCSKKGKTWSPGQLRELRDLAKTNSGLLLGGLVGVLGTRTEPDLVLGIGVDCLLNGFYLTAEELRDLRRTAVEMHETNYLEVIRSRKGILNVYGSDSLPELLGNM